MMRQTKRARGTPGQDTDDYELALRGHMQASTGPDAWRLACQQAAGLERSGSFVHAERRWREAAELSRTGVDRHWCESRAHWCRRVRLREDVA